MEYKNSSISVGNTDHEIEITGSAFAINTTTDIASRIICSHSVVTTDGYRIFDYGGVTDQTITPGESFEYDCSVNTPIWAFESNKQINLDISIQMYKVDSEFIFVIDPTNKKGGLYKYQSDDLFNKSATLKVVAWNVVGSKDTTFEFSIIFESQNKISDHEVSVLVELIDHEDNVISESNPSPNSDPFDKLFYTSSFYGIKNKQASTAKIKFTIKTFKKLAMNDEFLSATLDYPHTIS